MKIYIFEPHPDDLLFGSGPILLDWIKEGSYDIHVITVTDGRACYRAGIDRYTDDVDQMSEDEVAKMRIQEAREAVKFLGIPEEHHSLLYFHDADGQKYVDDAISKVKEIIDTPDKLIIPSNHNKHIDHQATYDIATTVAKKLNLMKIEFFVYFISLYGKFKQDSIDKQFTYTIDADKREILIKWYEIYKSQHKMEFTNKMFRGYLETTEEVTYAVFDYDDMGNYYNF